jgi:hypothetical protein
VRYQQLNFHAYCWVAGPVSKMVSQQDKTFCVPRFEASRSMIRVQREFRARFKKDAPHNNVTRWYRQFVKLDACVKAGVLIDIVSDDNIERVREAFQ